MSFLYCVLVVSCCEYFLMEYKMENKMVFIDDIYYYIWYVVLSLVY